MYPSPWIKISILWLDQLLDVNGVGVLGARKERIGQLDVGFLGGVVGIPEKIVITVEAEGHVGQTRKQAVVWASCSTTPFVYNCETCTNKHSIWIFQFGTLSLSMMGWKARCIPDSELKLREYSPHTHKILASRGPLNNRNAQDCYESIPASNCYGK